MTKAELRSSDREVLVRYFSDLKMLFLKRFDDYALEHKPREFDERQLAELLQEIFYVRVVLHKKSKKVSKNHKLT